MKKLIYFVLAAAFGMALATSCDKEPKSFDESLLYGTWTSTQTIAGENIEVFDEYNSNGTGSQHYEGTIPQPFSWELEGDRLTVVHHTETRAADIVTRADIPFDYTVKTLTGTTLVYLDDRGRTVTCTKL